MSQATRRITSTVGAQVPPDLRYDEVDITADNTIQLMPLVPTLGRLCIQKSMLLPFVFFGGILAVVHTLTNPACIVHGRLIHIMQFASMSSQIASAVSVRYRQ